MIFGSTKNFKDLQLIRAVDALKGALVYRDIQYKDKTPGRKTAAKKAE